MMSVLYLIFKFLHPICFLNSSVFVNANIDSSINTHNVMGDTRGNKRQLDEEYGGIILTRCVVQGILAQMAYHTTMLHTVCNNVHLHQCIQAAEGRQL